MIVLLKYFLMLNIVWFCIADKKLLPTEQFQDR